MSESLSPARIAVEPAAPSEPGPATALRRAAKRMLTALRQRPAAAVGLGLIAFFVLVALIAPLIAPFPTNVASGPVYAAPSARHWLGTDDGGIDVLSLVLIGGGGRPLAGAGAGAAGVRVGGARRGGGRGV